MTFDRLFRASLTGSLVLTLAACGGGISSGDSNPFRRSGAIPTDQQISAREARLEQERNIARARGEETNRSTIWDLFENRDDPNTTVEVNKYLWKASLDILNFLPIENVDPFTGIIVTGYGTPPGGGRAYRATVYVQDPALDARSLKVSLVARGGGQVSPETQRAVEDAILTRARQLRIQDSKL